MKKTLLFLVAVMIIMATSCRHGLTDPFGEWTELTGNEELPTVVDTVSIIDTVFIDNVIVEDSVIYITITDTVTVIDTVNNETIVVDTVFVETVFDCFSINKNGNIVATSTDGDDYTISYNVTVDVTGDKIFAQPSEEPFKLDKTESSFNNDRAYFKVSKGNQEFQLPVYVRGANSVIINDEMVEPCSQFSVSASVNAKPDTEINGKMYETAEVIYIFKNGENESIATASQRVYAPKAEGEEPEDPEDPEQPEVNERLVTIEHSTQDGVLLVTGTIDNSLYGDTIAEVMIPLSLTIECQNKVIVEGNSFNFSVNGGCSQVNSQIVNTFKSEDNGMVVNYEEVKETFHQAYSACGSTVTVNQTVNCYNNFHVEFGGEIREIVIPLTIYSGAPTLGSTEVINNEAHKLATVPYTATLAGMSASASQEVEMIIRAISFDGQRVIEAYRTLSTNSHTSWYVYDCVLTETTNGADHYYHYREIVNGVEGAWISEKLTNENYAFITNKAYFSGHGKYGLAIYYHKNYSGPFVGVVTDDIGGSYNEVVYHAFGKEQKTVTASRFAVFGELNTAIAGSSVEENGLIKMTCQEVTLNETQVLSNAGVVYFY